MEYRPLSNFIAIYILLEFVHKIIYRKTIKNYTIKNSHK